jgi:hypothetical protein
LDRFTETHLITENAAFHAEPLLPLHHPEYTGLLVRHVGESGPKREQRDTFLTATDDSCLVCFKVAGILRHGVKTNGAETLFNFSRL